MPASGPIPSAGLARKGAVWLPQGLRHAPRPNTARCSLSRFFLFSSSQPPYSGCALLSFFDEADQVLQFLNGLQGVAPIALVAFWSQLQKPGADVFFRDIIPLGVGLQAQIDAHSRVLLLAPRYELERLRAAGSNCAFLLIGGDGLRQLRLWMQLLVERLDVGGFEKVVAPYPLIG